MTSVAWIPVPTIDEAVALVSGLVGLGASAVELMVAPALTAAGQAFAQTPSYWKTLDPKAAALLVEFGAEDIASARGFADTKVIELTRAKANLIHPVEFTSVAEAIELAWHVRERDCSDLIGKTSSRKARRSSPRTSVFRRSVWHKELADVAGTASQARVHPRCRGPRSPRKSSFHARRGSRWRQTDYHGTRPS